MDGDLVGFLPSEKCYEIKAFAKTKNGQKVVQLGLHRVFFSTFFQVEKGGNWPHIIGPQSARYTNYLVPLRVKSSKIWGPIRVLGTYISIGFKAEILATCPYLF